jgi:hypothetical protein
MPLASSFSDLPHTTEARSDVRAPSLLEGLARKILSETQACRTASPSHSRRSLTSLHVLAPSMWRPARRGRSAIA